MTHRKVAIIPGAPGSGIPVDPAPWQTPREWPPEVLNLVGSGQTKKSKLYRELRRFRETIALDLGGEENLSAAQVSLIALASRTRLLLESVDAYILSQSSLVDEKRKALIPAVLQRASLAASYLSTLQAIGLERKEKPLVSLAEIMARGSAPAQTIEVAAVTLEPKETT